MMEKLSLKTTGIGSLPHTEVEKGIDLVLETFEEIPYWPQFPGLGFQEDMNVQFSYNLPGIVKDEENKRCYIDTSKDAMLEISELLQNAMEGNPDSFAYEREHFHGLYGMLARKEEFGRGIAVKGQVTGPISLGFQITDENRNPLFYNEMYKEVVIENLKMMIRWQEEKMREVNPNTIMFLDEPFLAMSGSGFVSLGGDEIIDIIDKTVESIRGLKAIHCCGNMDWSLPMRSKIDILNFDAYNYETLLLYPEALAKYVERGGIIAWGIVPSNEELAKSENVESITSRFEKYMSALEEKGIDRDRLLASSMVTTSCGLGTQTVEGSEFVLALVRDVSKSLREKHGFD